MQVASRLLDHQGGGENLHTTVHLADAVGSRPVIVAGRGAVLADARESLETLGDRIGAVMATSAMANGFFMGNPWNIAISGGFSTPLAAELITSADLVLGFGATLNQWTTRNGALLGGNTKIIQVDIASDVRTSFRTADIAAVGDAAAAASLLADELARRGHSSIGFRTEEMARSIETRRFWNDEPYEESANGRIDPRSLSNELDRILPRDRLLAVDGGHFLGYPPMHIRVPDARSFIFPNAFMPIGLGLGAAIGAAVAAPDRLTVATVGDGGALMTLGELETIARNRLPVLVVVYDDGMAGAEAHHYGPLGYDLGLVDFGETDFATVARALGIASVTVRDVAALSQVEAWLGDRSGPMLIDAKIDRTVCAGWLEEAFRNSDHPTKHQSA